MSSVQRVCQVTLLAIWILDTHTAWYLGVWYSDGYYILQKLTTGKPINIEQEPNSQSNLRKFSDFYVTCAHKLVYKIF